MPAHRASFLGFGRLLQLSREPTRVPKEVSLGLCLVTGTLGCYAHPQFWATLAFSGVHFCQFGRASKCFFAFLSFQIMVSLDILLGCSSSILARSRLHTALSASHLVRCCGPLRLRPNIPPTSAPASRAPTSDHHLVVASPCLDSMFFQGMATPPDVSLNRPMKIAQVHTCMCIYYGRYAAHRPCLETFPADW